ncbi:MAG TPA: hypothetical protein VMK65_03840 [Longimicrobiales bacterium]|nr:hypothetical protein [Longimicrobiales bacterium]
MMREITGSRRSRLLALTLLVVTFLTGALAGAAVNRVLVARDAGTADAEPHRERHRGPSTEDFLSRIELSDEQRAEVDAILERRRQQIEATWDATRPRMRALVDSTRQEIAAALDEDQRAAYERFLAEHKEREHRKRAQDKQRREEGR